MRTLRAALLAALASLVPLAAQHFEQGRLYLPLHHYPESKGAGHIGHGETRMAVIDAHGRQTLLDLPPTLEGRRGICRQVATHRGTHYALGMLNHPLFDRVGDRYDELTQRNRRDRLPHVLYKRVGNGSWQALARLTPAQVRVDFLTFLPLDGDRFLVQTWVPSLEVAGRRVPWAILASDGRGGMTLEPVPGLEGLLEGPLWKAIPVRLSDRILLLQALPGGGTVTLDLEGHRRAAPALAVPGLLKAAAPRPDGRILLQCQGRQDSQPRFLPSQGVLLKEIAWPRSPQGRLLATWALGGRRDASPSPSPASWTVLDPDTGALFPLAPPLGGVRQAVFGPMHWAVLPNGNLRWHSELPMRAYGTPRLLDTLRLPLPPRKAQP